MANALDLKHFMKFLLRRFYLIMSFVLVAAGIAAVFSFFILKPVYEAQTQILVNQNNKGIENMSWSYLESELQLINTYNVIIKSPAILTKVIDELKLPLTTEELSKQITITNENKSKVINIKVEDDNPEQAVIMANKIAEVFQKEIPSLMSINNINILSKAKLSDDPKPIKPNKLLNISIAAVLGFMMGIGIALLIEMFDSTIKSEKDVEEILDLPIIGIISTIESPKEVGDNKR
ncbi:YveK family protein [Ureibacillus acetophenoni]|uniref:Capsular polysaccharide biosynthesis protein n=1 Tax=Ureibacillus acetophenoni TaxID=614649 RepID=A0A285UCT4_9BACL|nr:Wzz/FepE/Etk N-terminal domain-containing protein [Ureibacillus acetophenoni]SOC38396.1 capsular polysaccharide biosynthesis protein [Ureibacillus acetophenoni]